MPTKKIITIFLSFNCLVALPLCAEEQTLPPIKIGATLALSGKLAFMGKSERGGLEMAIERVNAQGGVNGRKLLLVTEDNQGEAKVAVTTVQKLLQVDKVDVIISGFTHVTQSIKDIVRSANRFMLYQASSREITKASPFFFRDYGDAEVSGHVLAKLMHDRKIKRYALLAEHGDACSLNEQGFKSVANDFGLEMTARETFNPDETDLRPLLIKLKSSNPEAFVFCAWREESLVMRQLKQLGMISIPTFHFHAPFLPDANSPEIRQLFSENGTISTWYGFTKDEMNPEQQKLLKDFKDRYGEDGQLPEVAFIYDDVFILAETLKACSSGVPIDPKCLREELLKIQYPGIAGTISFSDQQISNRKVLGLQMRDNKWVQIH